jgi:hypothetical protein
MPCQHLVGFLAGALVLAQGPAQPLRQVGVVPGPQDHELLRAAQIPEDGPGVLAYLRKRIGKEGDAPRLRTLIRQLGDNSYAAREEASRELVAVGPPARALLRQAQADPDREIACRAERCLAQIDRSCDPEVLAAAVRVLGGRKAEGSAEILLSLLPTTEDPGVVQEIGEALAAVAVCRGRPEPTLLRALGDPQPLARAAAAEALCRAGPAELRPTLRKLLHDPEAVVRSRTALALVEGREKDAVPALIGLLGEVPPREAGRIEEALNVLAGETAPATFPEPPGPGHKALWRAWWQENRNELDLARLDRPLRPLGFTLLAQLDLQGQGEVLELDASGRVRWRIGGLRNPIDIQVLAGDRLLVCEYAGRTVSERNFKGEVLWQRLIPGSLLGARRLAGGHTFVTTRERLLELDGAGKEVWSVDRPHDVAAAGRLRDGQVVVLTTGGQCLRCDARGRQLKSFPVGVVLSVGTQIECLPGGRVLIPLYSRNQVVEYDADGKVVWSAMVARPSSVQRLANGNTLVASRLSAVVLEVDRNGEEVWHYRTAGRPLRALRR